MSLTNRPDTVFRDKICSLRVLLVESDKNSLQNHQYMLLQNLHRVTPTTMASVGVSMILNGDKYDCVIVDAENCEMDMVDFFHIILKHQPQLSIIVMASIDTQMRLAKGVQGCEAVWFLLKPCRATNICNVLQHICKKKIELKEGLIPWLNDNRRVDTMVNRSPILDTTNRISSANDRGKQKMDLDRKNHLLFEDDGYDGGKRKEIKRRFKWTPDLDAKFMEALILLGIGKAYPSAILKHMNVPGLSHYRVARRLQIYQEKVNNRKKSSVARPMQEGHNYLQSLQSYAASKSFGLLTKSDQNDASIIQSNSLPKATNSGGIAFMNINNIRLKLQQLPPLPSTTTINNSSFGNKTIYDSRNEMQRLGLGEALMAPRIPPATMESQYNMGIMNSNNFGNQMQTPLTSWNYFPNQGFGEITMAPTMEPQYMNIEIDSNNSGNNGSFGETMATIGTNGNNLSNDFDHGNNGDGSRVNELEPYDRYGIAIEQWATGGPNSSDSSNDGSRGF